MKKLTTLLAALALGASVHAEWAPKGPVTMLIAFAAGGGADTQARLIASEIEARKGWKIIPQAATGKGGAVAAAKLKDMPNDGTALAMIVSETISYNMLATKSPGYSEQDFSYLSTTAGTQFGLVTRSVTGWKTMSDALSSGKKLSFGVMSPKLADAAYLVGKTLNTEFNIVSLKGGKAVLNAINAGDVDLGWVAGVQAKGVQSGQLVNLASGEDERLAMSPEAPTLNELGADLDLGIHFMFVAPAGLSAEAQQAWTQAIQEVINDPSTKANQFINKAFGGPVAIGGEALKQNVLTGMQATRAMMKRVDAD
jgi:tripartite-type tricarboxylate transporter receptor subunit TctC